MPAESSLVEKRFRKNSKALRNARTANATKWRLEMKNQVSLPSRVEEAPAGTTATSAEEGPLVATQTTTVSSTQPSIATQASMSSDHDGDSMSIGESIAPRDECENCSRQSCCHCGDVDGALKEAADRPSATEDGDSDLAMSVTDEGERCDSGYLMDTGNPQGERNSPDFATALCDEKYKYRRVCGPIHLVEYPPVAVCKTCKCVVADPVSHMQTKHKVKVSKDLFRLQLANRQAELVTEEGGRMAQLPFVDVKEDGRQCASCGVCGSSHVKLDCPCRSALTKRQLLTVPVQVVKIGKQGIAMPIVRGERRYDSVSASVDEIYESLRGATVAAPLTRKEQAPFYRGIGWFVKDSELKSLVDNDLHRLFLKSPDSTGGLLADELQSAWETELWKIFVRMLSWAESLPLQMRQTANYLEINDGSKAKYSTTYVQVIRFLRNLNKLPAEKSSAFPLVFPFRAEVEELERSAAPQPDAVLHLVYGLAIEEMGGSKISVVEAMLKSACIDPTSGELRDSLNVLCLSSRLIKLWRVTCLLRAHTPEGSSCCNPLSSVTFDGQDFTLSSGHDFDDDIEELESGLQGLEEGRSTEIRDVSGLAGPLPSVYTKLKELTETCLSVKSGLPFALMTSTFNSARLHSPIKEPEITNLGTGKISFNGKVIDIATIKQLYKLLLADCSNLVKQQSLGCDTTLSLSELVEDIREFPSIRVVDPAARTPRPLDDSLVRKTILKYLVESRTIEDLTVKDAENNFRFDPVFADEYIRRQDLLEGRLLLLIHLTGGMTARGTELETLRFRSHNTYRRNVFLFDGHLYIQPGWGKSAGAFEDITQYRFLDSEVSELLARVLLFIKPMADQIAAKNVAGYVDQYLHRLFVYQGKAMSSGQVRGIITGYLSDYRSLFQPTQRVSTNITFREFRHVVKHFFDMCAGETLRLQGDSSLHPFINLVHLNASACHQAGHSAKTGSTKYAISTDKHTRFNAFEFTNQLLVSAIWWTLYLHECGSRSESSEVKAVMTSMSVEQILKQASGAVGRAEAIRLNLAVPDAAGPALRQSPLTKDSATQVSLSSAPLKKRRFGEDGEGEFVLYDEVAAPILPSIASRSSEKQVAEVLGSLTTAVRHLVNVSVLNSKQEVKVLVSGGLAAGPNPFSLLTPIPAQQPMPKDLRPMVEERVRALEVLQSLRGDRQATWSSTEQRDAVVLALTDESFSCIMPTGSGKSTTFFACAADTRDQLVVVIVPTTSLQEEHGRTADRFEIPWSKDKIIPRGLLILTYQFVTAPSCRILDSLVDKNKVRRFFFDECHKLLSDDFIDPRQLPNAVTGRGVPATMLTATARPGMLEKLQEFFGVDVHRRTIRMSVNRPNLEFFTLHCTRVTRKKVIKELIHGEETGRVVVLCSTTESTSSIAADLTSEGVGAVPYNSSLADKETNLMKWLDGVVRVIVATTALCEGMDKPDVRLVIVAEPPYSVEDFAQIAGRAGRDGGRAKVVQLVCDRYQCKSEEVKIFMEMIMKLCIRSVVTTVFDGQPTICKDSTTNLLCSVCSQTPAPLLPRVHRAEAIQESVDPRNQLNGSHEEDLSSAEAGVETREPAGEAFLGATPLEVELNIRTPDLSMALQERHHGRVTQAQGEVSSFANALSLLDKAQVCRWCNPTKTADHNTQTCPLRNPDMNCKICHYASALHHKHNYTNCMFKRDMTANLSREKKFCGGCWRPNSLKNHKVHQANSFGLDCAHFSSKLYWIYVRSRELQGTLRAQEQLMEEFGKLNSVDKDQGLVSGLVWFWREHLANKIPHELLG